MAVYQPFDYPHTFGQSGLRGAVREQEGKLSSRLEGLTGKKGGWLPEGERFHAPQGMRTQRSLMSQKLHPEILRQLGENTGQAQSSSGWAKSPWLMICLKGESLKKKKQSNWKSLVSITCQLFPKLTHLIVPIYNHIPDKLRRPDKFSVTYVNIQILSKRSF